MKKIFKIFKFHEKDKRLCRIEIDLKLGEIESTIPLTRSFDSYEDFKQEIEALKEHIDLIEKEAKEYLFRSTEERPDITDDMTPQEIWSVLSNIQDEDRFIKEFNLLPQDKRRDIADYVFTHCNVFSGMASIFSARYNYESALME